MNDTMKKPSFTKDGSCRLACFHWSSGDRAACRLAMLAGNFFVWNMVFNLMDKCPATRPLAVGMMPSTRHLETVDVQRSVAKSTKKSSSRIPRLDILVFNNV